MAKRRPRFESLEARLCMAAPTLQTSFSLPSGSWTPSVYRASPLFYDIFGTGKDDLIAVSSGAHIVAYAENADGSATPIIDYKVPGGVADIKSTPVVVTDPRTGQKELFAAMGRDENHDGQLEDGRVFGWDLKTGALLPAWANGVSTGHNPQGYSGTYGAIATGDLEGTGVPDLVVTSFSHEVTALRLDGSILWQWTNDDTMVSGAVIADIDRDGKPEVVVGGDSSQSPFFRDGGWVNVLSNTGALKWRRQILNEVTWSSPVVADLQGNGYLDVVIGTGDNFSYHGIPGATDGGAYLYAFDAFGNMLPGWPYRTTFTGDPQPHEVLNSPAVADLLGNGQLEVVAIDRAGYLHVVQANGQDLPGFGGGKRITPDLPQTSIADDYASPTIADVNGDGKPEIIATAGPYIRAFDASGNLINIGVSTPGTGGLVEGFDIAPAVGNFDGSGALTIAAVTFDANNQNRPDHVQIYQLPPSNLAPPWPFLRRTVTSDAVARSTVFDQRYVAQAFNTLLGGQPDLDTAAQYVGLLNADRTNLLSTAQLIASSTQVRASEVGRIYQAYLGRGPESNALVYWANYLAGHTYRQMEILVSSSAEFAQRANNNLGHEVVLLYQAILKRTPSTGEVNYWVATNAPAATLASVFINSPEGVADQLNAIVPGASALPPDALASFSYDIHTGRGEEGIIANILVSNYNYAATNFVAGYVRDVYRDVLARNASASDVAYWVSSVDNGSVPFTSIAFDILNSTEARELYIQSQFLTLLGHPANQATLAALANYSTRENIDIFLVGSPEYYTRNGGTPSSFVLAAFRDLTGITPDASTVGFFTGQMAKGLSTSNVAHSIIYGGTLYFQFNTVNLLTYYLPDYSQGVLRTGELPIGAPGQPINPDPNLINYFLGLTYQGQSDEQVIAAILNTPQYYGRVSYYKGLFRSPGVRF